MADPPDADVIGTIHRDAVPGQRAIRGGELMAAGAGVGGAQMHSNVDRRALAADDFHAGPNLFRKLRRLHADFVVAQRKRGNLIAAGAVGFLLQQRGYKLGLLARPYYFLLTNVASLIAALRYLQGERMVTWTPVR